MKTVNYTKSYMKPVLFVLIAVLCVSAFAQDSSENKGQDQDKDQAEEVVNYNVIEQGTYSGLKEETARVLQTTEDWQTVWKTHVSMLVPQPPVPQIDFATISVVVIAAGEQKTSGYGIVLKDITAEANDVIVKYHFTSPPENSFTLQVITQPFLMLRVQKPAGTIKLVKE